MIEIDGSFGEGGGQVLRTAVAFSAITGEPLRVYNIRAGRENPGLRPQHLKSLEAVGGLCGAQVTGLSVGSTDVTFTPNHIQSGRFRVDIGTAGSLTLLLQALLPVALCAPGRVELELVGGTDVAWSPTIDYFRNVFMFFLAEMGADVKVEVKRRGFYPKGGGVVDVTVEPWANKSRLDLTETAEVKSVHVVSVATEHLRKQEVAERQVKGFMKLVSLHYTIGDIVREYVDSDSVGSSFHAYALYDDARVGVCVLGERGLKAEDVGRKAAQQMLFELGSGAPLDEHMGDQIISYIALAGGTVKVSKISKHAETNINIVRRFGFNLSHDGSTVFNGT